MKKIVVYHPQNSHINGGNTEFHGENVEHSITDDGGLLIKNWQTPTEQGHARFAPGQWAYVCASRAMANGAPVA
jgi:hypothetical protein